MGARRGKERSKNRALWYPQGSSAEVDVKSTALTEMGVFPKMSNRTVGIIFICTASFIST